MRVLAALLFASTLHAASWIKLSAPGIEFYSDASEKSARQAIDRLLLVRRVLPPSDKPDAAMLRVFLFHNKSDYLPFAPKANVAGFYQHGFEREFIALYEGDSLPRIVVHEYVHSALRQQLSDRDPARPAWMEEGLADFYSTVEPVRAGVRVGVPIAEHLQLLSSRAWLTAQQMNAPVGNGSEDLFYAQSWALAHMLRAKTPMPDQVTPQMLIDLRPYLRQLRAEVLPVPSAAVSIATAVPLSTLDQLLARGELALRTGHQPLAATLYAQAARDYPRSPAAATGLAILARDQGRNEDAHAQLRRTLELDDRYAAAWLELGLLDDDPRALEKAVQLNPDLGEAHAILGSRAIDDGDLQTALSHLQLATRLLPRKSYVWYSLGFAQNKAGQRDAAIESFTAALRTATTPEQANAAQTLLDSLRTR